MATLREIRRRIISVRSTQKITRAMKMVAAAKLRKAQDNVVNARPYAKKYKEMIIHLAQDEDVREHPFIHPPSGDPKILLVIVTSDRSLCGAFNSNIFRKAKQKFETDFKKPYERGDLKLLTVGRKGYDYFHKRGFSIANYYIDFFKDMNFAKAQGVVSTCVREFTNGNISEVYVLYNEFKSALQQEIKVERLLPIELKEESEKKEDEKNEVEKNKRKTIDYYIYEQDIKGLLNMLVPRYLNVEMWRIMLESFAAEMGARMTAMDTATENAGELLGDLSLFYNRTRQAAITKEILEVVSGAEVLQK